MKIQHIIYWPLVGSSCQTFFIGVTTPRDKHTFILRVSLQHLFDSKDFLVGGLQLLFIKWSRDLFTSEIFQFVGDSISLLNLGNNKKFLRNVGFETLGKDYSLVFRDPHFITHSSFGNLRARGATLKVGGGGGGGWLVTQSGGLKTPFSQ